MTLRETMARHSLQPLTRLDHFGETVTYRFKSGAPDRQVPAVVNRLDVEPGSSAVTQVAKMRAFVAIAVHETNGITTVAAGDQIVLSMRLGTPPVVARVKRIESQDEGMFLLEVER